MNRAITIGVVLVGGCRWHFGLYDEQVDAPGVEDSPDAASCGHTFCDNFDRSGPVEAGWDSVINTGNAVLSLVTTASVSAPQSYEMHHPGTSLEQGFLVKALPMPTSSVVVDLQFAYETSNVNDAEIDMLRLKWDTPAAGCDEFGFYLVRDGTKQFNLQETYAGVSCGANEQNYSADLPNTGWHAARLTVTLGAVGTARVKLVLGSTTIVDHTTSHAILPSTVTLELGAGAQRNIVAPWDFRYDDLIVDVQ